MNLQNTLLTYDEYSHGHKSSQFMPQVVCKSRQLSKTYDKYKPISYERSASKAKIEQNIAK